jgi:hypothetical protein
MRLVRFCLTASSQLFGTQCFKVGFVEGLFDMVVFSA